MRLDSDAEDILQKKKELDDFYYHDFKIGTI